MATQPEATTSLTPSQFNDLIHLKSSENISDNSSFSLGSFLDMTLPPSEPPGDLRPNERSTGTCLTSDKFLSCDDNSLLNLLDCKTSSDTEQAKSEENLLSNGQWLTSESNDVSLSSLLGNLDGNSIDETHTPAESPDAKGNISPYFKQGITSDVPRFHAITRPWFSTGPQKQPYLSRTKLLNDPDDFQRKLLFFENFYVATEKGLKPKASISIPQAVIHSEISDEVEESNKNCSSIYLNQENEFSGGPYGDAVFCQDSSSASEAESESENELYLTCADATVFES